MSKNQSKLSTLIIIFFILLSSLHLYGCLYENNIIRFTTKVMLMPNLFILYKLNTDENIISKTYLYGIFFGWLGDVFLIGNDLYLSFIPGAISFILGHIFYIICLIRKITKKNLYSKFYTLLSIYGIFYLIAVFLYKNYFQKWINNSTVLNLICVYLGMLCFLASLAWLLFFIKKNKYSFSIAIGAIIFWYSDFNVTKNMFDKSAIDNSFLVMITYILAQSLICFGMHKIN